MERNGGNKERRKEENEEEIETRRKGDLKPE